MLRADAASRSEPEASEGHQVWRSLLQFALLGAALFAADRLWWRAAPAPVVIPAARAAEVGRRAALPRRARARLRARRSGGLPPPGPEPALRGRTGRARRRRAVRRSARAAHARERPGRAAPADPAHAPRSRGRGAERRTRRSGAARALRAPCRELSQRQRACGARSSTSAATTSAPRAGCSRGCAPTARRPSAALQLGEPFLHGAEQPLQTSDELAGRFGAPFAEGVFAAPPGAWSGPIRSAYGVHLVFVHEREAPRALGFEEVRDSLRHAVIAERRRAALERGLRALREEIPVVIEPCRAFALANRSRSGSGLRSASPRCTSADLRSCERSRFVGRSRITRADSRAAARACVVDAERIAQIGVGGARRLARSPRTRRRGSSRAPRTAAAGRRDRRETAT